jgi:AsmA protein
VKKLLKWLLGLAGTIAVLLVALSLALPLIVDPNNYKDRISERVRQETGRDLVIHGDIDWQVFPRLGLAINDMSLGNRAGFGDRPMLDVAETTVSVALWPLLNRQVVIRSVALDGVKAYLRENADGRNNWQDLSATYRAGSVTDMGDDAAPAALEVEVSAGDIELHGIARNLEVEGFRAPATTGIAGQAFELQGDLALAIPQLQLGGELGYTGFVQADPSGRLLALEDLELGFEGRMGNEGEALELDLQASTDAVVDMANDRARFNDIALSLFDLALGGALEVTSLSGDMAFDGALQLAEFNPKDLLDSMGMGVLETRNPKALTRMQVRVSIGGNAGAVKLSGLDMALDESTLTGDLLIRSFAPLQMDFNLALDVLDLDAYAVLADEAGGQKEVAAEGAGLLVGSMLFFTGEGKLAISRLTLLGLRAQDVNLGLISQGNEIRLFPINSRLYGGQHQGDVRVVFTEQWPVLTANQMVTGLDTATLLQDLSGGGRLHGTADVYFQVSSQLGGAEMARRTLSGDAGLSVLDGVIGGIDIMGAIEEFSALLGRPATGAPAPSRGENLEFTEIIATGVIERGVLRSDDLMVRSPYVEATGRGTINLVDETINYLFEPVPVNELARQLPKEYRGIPIPLRVSGSLSDPSVTFDLAGGIAAAHKAQLFDKAGDAAGKLLEGLFGKKGDKGSDGKN